MDRFNIATFEYLRIDYFNQYDQAESFSAALPAAKRFVEAAGELDYRIAKIVLGFTIMITGRDGAGFRAAPNRVFAETVFTPEAFRRIDESWYEANRRRAGVEIDAFTAENYGALRARLPGLIGNKPDERIND